MQNALDLQLQLTKLRFDEWLSGDIFHPRWWILSLLFILDVWAWWKIANKSRLPEIILCAAVTAVMILVFDEIGEELTLWNYPTDVFPLFPPIASIDLACLPLLYSLTYQFFTKWKSFIIASTVLSALSCFVFEPIFVWIKMYQMLQWKSWYGLPLYFTIGLLGKAAVSLALRIERRAETRRSRPDVRMFPSGRFLHSNKRNGRQI